MTKHSEKALQTLTMMDTTATDWTLTEIKWVEEEREVPGEIECPTCHGGIYVCKTEDGAVIPPPPINTHEAFNYRNAARRQAGGSRGNCPTCRKPRRGWGLICTGTVRGLVRRKVLVGYPQFPAGTTFDSRFAGRGSCCHLCNKTILKSGRVPVNTTGDKPHGMWVGEDCAKKFLSVKIKRAADSVMED